MDDNPREFLREFRSAILKKRAGQIALAVVLAEACIRLLNAFVWFAVIPIISGILQNHSESVLFETKRPFQWQQLFGSILEFILALIFVFYVNRWIRGSLPRPRASEEEQKPEAEHPESGVVGEVLYNIAGQPVSTTERKTSEQ